MADWVVVSTAGTEEEASLMAGFLEAAGIVAQIESLRFHQEPVNFGPLGEVRVLVRAGDLEAARAALEGASPSSSEDEDAGPESDEGEA